MDEDTLYNTVCDSVTTRKIIAMKVISVSGHNLLKALQSISIIIRCHVFTLWKRETNAKMGGEDA